MVCRINLCSPIEPYNKNKKKAFWGKQKAVGEIGTKNGQEVKVEELFPHDVVIGVMGPTGAGKSTFIEWATGIKRKIGDTLESCTDEISVIRFSAPEISVADICLVDTPGFGDIRVSDVDILRMISNWLNDTYKRKIPLAGLLYLHRITDTGMPGSAMQNLNLFEKICGKHFSTIVLTTTMWDIVEPEIGKKREGELQQIYWKSMIDRGSSVRRFLCTRDSAVDVLRPILTRVNEKQAVLLQKEVTDLGRKLKETEAGRALAVQLEELFPKQQEKLKAIQEALIQDQKLPEDQLAELMKDYQEVNAKFQQVVEDIKKMKISVGFLDVLIKHWKAIQSVFRPNKQLSPLSPIDQLHPSTSTSTISFEGLKRGIGIGSDR